jgi:hypothetical protein
MTHRIEIIGNATLYLGDCFEVMQTMLENSVDSIVTDPPYGLSFMGKHWDHGVPSAEVWVECLRVLKPGGHLLAFAGTRTQHRMATAIEDAGFEIRDMIAWVYGSGFPKSHNLKDDWQGWGTALKPALEPITVARKPLIGTVAANVLAHGTGALNIDGCRVWTNEDCSRKQSVVADTPTGFGKGIAMGGRGSDLGRWPANLIHDGSEEVVELFPQSAGQQGDVKGTEQSHTGTANCYGEYGRVPAAKRGDTGSAARFFYCAKASKSGRGEGNNHPTVKPTDLMRYLCRLVTPPGGIVLDPFMGSCSTGVAAGEEGFAFIGIEREAEYLQIACQRIENAYQQSRLFV